MKYFDKFKTGDYGNWTKFLWKNKASFMEIKEDLLKDKISSP